MTISGGGGSKRPRLMLRRTVSVASSLGGGGGGEAQHHSPPPGLSNSATSPAAAAAAATIQAAAAGKGRVGLGILAALDKGATSGGMVVRSHIPAAALSNMSINMSSHTDAKSPNVGGFFFPAPSFRKPTLDFLDACFLCNRDISHGRDIYMYRGDRAFCSVECRQQQILNDERSERRQKCSSAALKQMGGSSQPARHVNQRAPKVAPATTAAAA